jgi:hypothetical protein
MAAFDEGLTICRCGAMKSDHQVKRALIKLDISYNYIGAEQEGNLQRICVMASGVELAT